MLWS